MFGAKQHRRRQQYHANNFRQLMENFRRKRAESLSWLFVAIWLTGDLSNLTGCLLTGQLPFQTYLASYFVMMDTLLMFQWVYYNRNDGTSLVEDDEQTVPLLNEDTDEAPTGENYARFHKQPLNPSLPILTLTMGLIALTVPTMAIPTNQRVLSAFDDSVPWHYRLGEASAWLSVACYLSSRLPQIHKNLKRQSVEGLSIWLFIFALLGNSTYTISIFLQSTDREFLMKALPFIMGSAVLALFAVIDQ